MKRIFLCALFFAGNCSVSASEQPVDHLALAASASTAVSLLFIIRATWQDTLLTNKDPETLRHVPEWSNAKKMADAGTVVLAATSLAAFESGHTNFAAVAAFGGALTSRWSLRLAEKEMAEAQQAGQQQRAQRFARKALNEVLYQARDEASHRYVAEGADDIEDIPLAEALRGAGRAAGAAAEPLKNKHRCGQWLICASSSDKDDAAQAIVATMSAGCGK